MSVDDIMNSYESVLEMERVSCKHSFFTDGNKIKRHHCGDIDFFINLMEHCDDTPHNWCMVPNYYNTKVFPFIPYEDYKRLDPKLFDFTDAMDNSRSYHTRYGKYIVWPEMSANFLGWVLYLYINSKYWLPLEIPLKNHVDLGAFNLISNNMYTLDISCKFVKEDSNERPFSNTNQDTQITLFHVEASDNVKVLFSNQCTYSHEKRWFEYMVKSENIHKCTFLPEYKYLCDTIDFDQLRWLPEYFVKEPNVDVVEKSHVGFINGVEKITPCSNFELEIVNTIELCYNIVNEDMLKKSTVIHNNTDLLSWYMFSTGYSTFYILLISMWHYCEVVIKMHNQYSVHDILFFLKTLCDRIGGNHDLYVDNLIYFSSPVAAKNFMNSLEFFVNPEQGAEEYFNAISSYFAIHLSVKDNDEKSSLNDYTVKKCGVEDEVKSVGFFKKIKVGKFDYIFNGNLYVHYKNKKDNALAAMFSKCPDVTVSSLLFNKTLNFYMTEHGVFDVCKKVYKEFCPFLVTSTLKQSFISKEQDYLDKDVFNRLYSAIDKDLQLFKIYHARKFLDEFEIVCDNLKYCNLVGESMAEKKYELENRWKDLIVWLLESKASDIVILMIKRSAKLDQAINNIVALPITIDLMGLQVAITCHLMWPDSKIELFFWALMCNTVQDFEDWLEGFEMGDLSSDSVYNNKKKITEAMHQFLYNYNYDDEMSLEKIESMVNNLSEPDKKKYEQKRIVKNIGIEYKKYNKMRQQYNVWSDLLLVYQAGDNMYDWLTRFYIRIFLNDYTGNMKQLYNVVLGFSYFRVFTNFHSNNSKALINFCASLAQPINNEKMCLVLSSKPNCGKSSLWELFSKNKILVYKQDKEEYRHSKTERDEKVKLYESQLYVMNEAQKFSKTFLKTIVDSTRIDSARCNYGIMENFNITFKALVCNNEDDKILIHGYDRACSNRIGQMYFDHDFDDSSEFSGSVYEHYLKKKYCEVRDVTDYLKEPVRAFLANILQYKCNPKDGQLYYKCFLQSDNTYKHNKKCLYIYNNSLEALLYVINVKELKTAPEFSEEVLIDTIKLAEKYVVNVLHYSKRNGVSFESLCGEFKKKYQVPRFFNPETNMYMNIQMTTDEKYFQTFAPRFRANVDIGV
ncbi:helicase [Cryptophlebia leucotreta granulovirus]|uniref:Helicase n=1 Tax=Cryptophlebia leucotreta granulosis virus TaxID=35254 RepID=Q7T5L2_GVCL|nr:helicase [Cryptophlebia leucotreta granulovirus]AAQ21676.1 helicase [Cryptophlebia leucotreta granulovirus]